MQRTSYSRIFTPTAFPVLDRFNKTHIYKHFKFLLESEHWTRQQQQDYQQAKLEKAIEFTKASSDFYRDFWKNAPKDRRAKSNFACLDGMPVVTKPDLADAANQFPLSSYSGRVITSRTSGSTGKPMVFHRSSDQESWFWALRFRMWSWAGYYPGERYLEINLNPRIEWKKRLQDVLFRCDYLTFNADNQDSALIVEKLRKNKILHINGFSSSLYVLARYMLDNGIENPGVIGITSTGDGLFPAYRETIEKAFGVRVLDYYGAGGEGFHLASQCPDSGERYHIHPENALVEILDSHGPVSPGERGRIVVTQFDNEAMPLIRYELGDTAVMADDQTTCACGRTLPMLESVEGRVPDLVSVPTGGFLVPHFFVVLFKNIQDVDVYQIVQDKPASMRVRLVARDGADKQAIEKQVRKAVEEATQGTLAPEFEWVSEIPLTGAGKRRLVISTVSMDVLGVGGANPAASMNGANGHASSNGHNRNGHGSADEEKSTTDSPSRPTA